VSVLIASHNRRDLLRRCLASLGEQTAPADSFEVVLVDDGSTDGTDRMLEGLDVSFEMRVLRLEQSGKYRAINAAIEAAAAAACLILDDDVVASPGLVAAHAAAHREDPTTLGIGALTQKPPDARDWYARAFSIGWNEHYDDFDRRKAAWTDCYGANFSAPRATLLEVGGFATDLSIAGDLEIGYRLERAGCSPRYLPAAHGVHDDQKGWRRMQADLRRQGLAHVELAERHPGAAPQLLDREHGAGPIELRLRRALIALGAPVAPLVAIGALLPGEGRRMIWFHVIRRFAFWRAARSGMDRRRWAEVTHRTRDGDAP
jgi:glycosyltransferase involved in cell wall biosynthesis